MNARPFPRALPLHWKLTLLAAVVLTTVLTIFGVVLYTTLRDALFDTTAKGLSNTARAAINERLIAPSRNPAAPPAVGDTQLLVDFARYLTTRSIAARTTDTEGNTVGDGPALAAVSSVHAPLLDPAVYREVARTRQKRSLRVQTADEPALVYLTPLAKPGDAGHQTIGVFQLSTSLRSADDLLTRLRLLLIGGTLLAIGTTILLTIPLVRGVLRPLRRMAATSSAIAGGDLSQRVAVPAGGDELTDLARAFNDMVSRLDAAFATQRRFIADASHELRSPLTALGGGVEMLLLRADRDDPAARARLLHLMEGEIGRMSRLVDDLLTLTRFDAHPLEALQIGPVELTGLAAQVADETRLLAPDRTVVLDTPPESTLTVPGDADRLRQVLLNLCANARAYTPPAGTITIRVRQAATDAVLTVADTGPGIPPEELPRVWDRFRRVDPARARQAGQGGLGLGLAIVRAIITAHHGSTAITSTPGTGTTVTVTLPGATATAASPVAARTLTPV